MALMLELQNQKEFYRKSVKKDRFREPPPAGGVVPIAISPA
jgi:hypothetical protein